MCEDKEAAADEDDELTAEDLAEELRVLQRRRSFGGEIEPEDFRLMREYYSEEVDLQ